MNAQDFLSLAQTLSGQATEACWRSAISRAYYAAFHVARVLLRDLGFRIPRADQAHAYLWLRLSNCGEPQIQVAGQRLRDLRSERNRADYDIETPLLQAAAAVQIRIAEDLIQFLDSARVEPIRTRVTQTMRAYEKNVLGTVTWQTP
jgi:uncharacterized protein (UPF0332 family)